MFNYKVGLESNKVMKKKMKFIIDFVEVEVKAHPGESLLDLAIRMKLPLQHSCGGMGTCGTCRVIVREGLGELTSPGEVEKEIIQDRGFVESERLACQNESQDGLVVEIPPSIFKT